MRKYNKKSYLFLQKSDLILLPLFICRISQENFNQFCQQKEAKFGFDWRNSKRKKKKWNFLPIDFLLFPRIQSIHFHLPWRLSNILVIVCISHNNLLNLMLGEFFALNNKRPMKSNGKETKKDKKKESCLSLQKYTKR